MGKVAWDEAVEFRVRHPVELREIAPEREREDRLLVVLQLHNDPGAMPDAMLSVSRRTFSRVVHAWMRSGPRPFQKQARARPPQK